MSNARGSATRIELLEKRRLQAGTMFAAGARTVEVARTFNVAWRTAFKWRQSFLKDGAAGLQSRGRPGREPLLNVAQRRRLHAIVRAGAERHGFPDNRWTLTRIHEVTQRVFGVKCSKVSVWRLVRRSLASSANHSRTA